MVKIEKARLATKSNNPKIKKQNIAPLQAKKQIQRFLGQLQHHELRFL